MKDELEQLRTQLAAAQAAFVLIEREIQSIDTASADGGFAGGGEIYHEELHRITQKILSILFIQDTSALDAAITEGAHKVMHGTNYAKLHDKISTLERQLVAAQEELKEGGSTGHDRSRTCATSH